jgi:hypothetical protein
MGSFKSGITTAELIAACIASNKVKPTLELSPSGKIIKLALEREGYYNGQATKRI